MSIVGFRCHSSFLSHVDCVPTSTCFGNVARCCNHHGLSSYLVASAVDDGDLHAPDSHDEEDDDDDDEDDGDSCLCQQI